MGIVFRQSIKTTIVTFAGALLGALTVYLSTKFIPDQGYGFSKTLLSQALVASQLTLVGMHTTLYIFINRYSGNDERRKVLMTLSTIVPIVITLVASVLYFILKYSYINSYKPEDRVYMSMFFIWLPVYTLLWSVMTLFEHYLLSQLKVAISNFIKEIILRGCNIVLVILFALNVFDFYWFIVLSVLIHIVPIIILYILSTKTDGFGFSFNWGVFNRDEYKKIIDFAVFHLFVNVSVVLLIYVDQLMLGILDKSGLVSVAVYSVAIYIMSIFQIPIRAISSSVAPIFTKEHEAGNFEKLRELFSKSAINLLIVICAMAAVILCNMHNAVSILNKSYSAIFFLVPILIMGRFIDSMSGLNTEILTISKYYRFNLLISVLLLLVVIVFNYLLIPKYGVYGAAWANTIGFTLYNLAKYLFLWYKMDMQPFSKKSILVLIAIAPAAAAGYYMPHIGNAITDAIIRSIMVIVIFTAMLIYLKPSEELQEYLKNLVQKKRLY